MLIPPLRLAWVMASPKPGLSSPSTSSVGIDEADSPASEAAAFTFLPAMGNKAQLRPLFLCPDSDTPSGQASLPGLCHRLKRMRERPNLVLNFSFRQSKMFFTVTGIACASQEVPSGLDESE